MSLGSDAFAGLSGCVAPIWPVAIFVCFIGPPLLVIPWGATVQPLPITRSALWRIQFARDATWLLFGGGVATAVLFEILAPWACVERGVGVVVGFIACLTSYVPAVAYRLMLPSGKLRRDRRTGQQYLELRRVHHLFATAVNDRLRGALTPVNMADAAPPVATPISPVPPTWPVVAATILTVALIIGLTVVVLVATGGSVLACHPAGPGSS